MKTLNLGILAHVDAGKTSLTERLLYLHGVIDEVGSVDDGSTQTDSMELERQRGITIKSAVVSFLVGDVTVNLIDTPGHPDFIAEVERVLNVLDGAVLVVSGVDGVQAQTRVLMRALQRLRIPTLVFVNKIDQRGARYDSLLESTVERLTPSVIPMGTTQGLGTAAATFTPYPPDDPEFQTRLLNTLAEHNDTMLATYVDDGATPSREQLWHELAAQTARALVHPVYFGSALTGAGTGPLISGITELLPALAGDAGGPLAGSIFKIERGAAREKIAYVRMFSGTLRVRDRLRIREDAERKVTAVCVFEQGRARQRPEIVARQIGQLRGLDNARVGDVIGQPPTTRPRRHFAPPTLETVIAPRRPADLGALYDALVQLGEQDPLIDVRRDDLHQEIFLSLYGEVQKEIIEATLARDFGIKVTFSETTTICIERPIGVGEAVEWLGKEPNPFLATVGLRVEPGTPGAGVGFRLEIELGSMPRAFIKAVEETVRETLRQGLHGWQVLDIGVTLTHSRYLARQSSAHGGFDKNASSTAGDFRNLAPLVLMAALTEAGTAVHEPIHHFRLEIPADRYGALLPVLTRLRGIPDRPDFGRSTCVLEGEIPAAHVQQLHQQLLGLTRGEGVLESAFARYQEVTGIVPDRPRWDHNPLNRSEYLLHVMRQV